MTVRPLHDDAEAALHALLGAVLTDADVTAVDVHARHGVTVTRRGRRESLAVDPTAFLATLANVVSVDDRKIVDGSSLDALSFATSHGHVVHTLGAGADRLVHVVARHIADVFMMSLLDEGTLDAATATLMMEEVQSGRHLIVRGASRAARRRAATAIATESAPYLSVFRESHTGPSAASVLPDEGTLIDRVLAAVALGAELVLLHDPPTTALRAVLAADIGAVIVCSTLAHPENVARDRVGVVSLSFGSGSPVSVVGPSVSVPQPLMVVEPSSPPRFDVGSERPGLMKVLGGPTLAAPNGPPDGWASSSHDDEPGWELASPGGQRGFDDVLRAVRDRPAFTPRPPPMHPAAQSLRGAGGLSFEPPGGELADDDDDESDKDQKEDAP